MKTFLFLVAATIYSAVSFAQSIDEGKKFLYYDRFKSAKDVFQKLSNANANDEVAAYYLGQAMIGLEDVAGAKALYQQKLSSNILSALLTAGMGHIGLLEYSADARSRFDAAASMAAGKRIDVLNAIGAPNSDPEIKNADPNYAIDILTKATAIKGFKDADVLANLGDAYRKIGDGGNAIKSYDAALAINPNYARAVYRKGRLYQAQGLTQEPLYLGFYNDAIAKDAKYAPVYNTLFNYYYESNVTKAADYLEKALAVSDDDPNACYKRASMKFAQKLFTEAITKSDECIAASAANPIPNLYGLKAYAYARLNDSTNAKAFFEQYFTKQIPSKIGAGDYTTFATILLKFVGSEEKAGEYIDKAVALDSLEANKITYLKQIATVYKSQNKLLEAANWYNKILSVKKNCTISDFYNAGYNFYRANKYDSSIAVFNKYAAKYPDDMFGTYMIAKNTAAGSDSTMLKGEAAGFYTKAIDIGERAADKSKVRDYLIGAYSYMMQYSFNIKKDQAAAISFADKAVALDPTDAQLLKSKEFVTKNSPTAPTTKPTSPKTTTVTPKKVVPTVPLKKK